MEKKYPIGGYATGSYQCHCATCGGGFIGDKRAYQCEPCALDNKAKFDALSPAEQEELMKRNAEIINQMFSRPATLSTEEHRVMNKTTDKLFVRDKQWGPVWIKASEQLPGYKIKVKWRDGNDHYNITKGTISIAEMDKPNLDCWEWLDESGTPAAGREERGLIDSEFIEFIDNERWAIIKEMRSDTWWLEIPATKRVAFENVLIAYDQMVEKIKNIK